MAERDYLRADFGGGGYRSPFWATIPGTKGLLIGLVAVHVLMGLLYRVAPGAWQAVWRVLALQPDLVLRKFFVWQLVTAALLHNEGIWHLLWNGVMIFFFGRLVEQRLGLRRYLRFCVGATLTASLAYLLWAVLRTDVRPMLGASGLAIGLTVLAAFWHPRATVLLFFVLPVPLWILAAGLIVLDLFQMIDASSEIAHMAHLGGALYAVVFHVWGARFGALLARIDRAGERRRATRELRRRAEEAELRREVDRILDKVNREGMAALSEQERRFLKQASERLRR